MLLPSSEDYFKTVANEARVRHPLQDQPELSAALNMAANHWSRTGTAPAMEDFSTFARFAQAAAMSQAPPASRKLSPAPAPSPSDPAAEQRMQLMHMIATMPEQEVAKLLRTFSEAEGCGKQPGNANKQRQTPIKKQRKK
eukprot:scaffold659579_cov66-Prasinocladus_malaysianus.AAC.1